MQTCPACGEENPEKFRLCGYCGAALSVAPVAAEVRKTVTIVFCDLVGSTALGERLDPESVSEVLSRYFDAMRTALTRHGGHIEKYIGDAVMAVFGLPRLHEDDALRAVRAAWEMQRSLEDLNRELETGWGVQLRNRIGVNTGEVVASQQSAFQRLVTGDTVNAAARLEQAAGPMEVLIGEQTQRLVRATVAVERLAPLSVKGKAEPLAAFRVLGVDIQGQAEGRERRGPLVGREEELAAVLGAFDRAVEDRRCRAVTLLGDAGVGKSRLVAELLERVSSRATGVRGRCLPYGEGITFWPLAGAVRDAAGILDGDSPAVALEKLRDACGGDASVAAPLAAATGLGPGSFALADTFWSARRFFGDLARRRPLLVLFEDVHWAERTFLELLEHIVDNADDVPLLILCTARRELHDDEPGFLAARARATTVVLEPLSAEHSAQLVEQLVGGGGLPEVVQARILAAAEGNPLFVEQMVSMLVDDGVLERDGEGRWRAAGELSAALVPPSISALLSARLDRLSVEERAVLQAASVAGATFARDAVAEMGEGSAAAGPPAADVDRCLAILTRKELIRRDDADLGGSQAYRFQHMLIRDCAYQGLLKRRRAELHERFGDWVLRVAEPRAVDHEEIVGYHLEQAHRTLVELGPVDAHGAEVGRRAAVLLAASGRRALGRGDMPGASNLLERAISLRGDADPERLELVADVSEALHALGDFQKAETMLGVAVNVSAEIGDERLEMLLRLSRQQLRYFTDPQGWAASAETLADRAIAVFEARDDHAGLARAWRLIAAVHGTSCRYGEAEAALTRSIEHARRGGLMRLVMRNLPSLGVCAIFGPTPIAEGIARCERLLEGDLGDRGSAARLRSAISMLYARGGEISRAERLNAESRSMLRDLGDRLHTALTTAFAGRIQLLAGDAAAAETLLRPELGVLEALGDRYYLSTVAVLLGEAVYRQGRLDEAEELARRSEATGRDDDVEAQYAWRSLRAKVAAASGRFDEARSLGGDAVAWARQADSPVMVGDALLDLAEVCAIEAATVGTAAGAAAGAAVGTATAASSGDGTPSAPRRDEALDLAGQALALYEAKGDVSSARRARALLDRLAGAAPLTIAGRARPRRVQSAARGRARLPKRAREAGEPASPV